MEKRVSTIRKEITKQTDERSLFWVHNDERNKQRSLKIKLQNYDG